MKKQRHIGDMTGYPILGGHSPPLFFFFYIHFSLLHSFSLPLLTLATHTSPHTHTTHTPHTHHHPPQNQLSFAWTDVSTLTGAGNPARMTPRRKYKLLRGSGTTTHTQTHTHAHTYTYTPTRTRQTTDHTHGRDSIHPNKRTHRTDTSHHQHHQLDSA
jgi:hypothetical protein